MIPTAALLISLLCSLAIAQTAMLDDLTNLTAACLKVAEILNASINDTTAMNTSDLIQSVGWEIGAAMADLGCTSSHGVPRANISISIANTSKSIDDAYFEYANSLGELSHATIARGRIPHQEPNLPVVQQLQSLSSSVYYYGRCLRNGGFISQQATIRSWTANSDITEAETAWTTNHNYPGPSPQADGSPMRAGKVRRSLAGTPSTDYKLE